MSQVLVTVEIIRKDESYSMFLPAIPRQGEYVFVNPDGDSPTLRNSTSKNGFWVHVAQVTWRDGSAWLACNRAQDYEILA